MTIAVVTSDGEGSTTGNGFTGSALDTTGANFIIVLVATGSGTTSGALSDFYGNTWTPLSTEVGGFGDRAGQFFYCENPTVGTSHTFTISGTGNFPALVIGAFSGVGTSSFDVQNGNQNGFNTTCSTGSVTPSVNNEIVIAGVVTDDGTSGSITIDSGFTVLDLEQNNNFGHTNAALAYLIQTTATTENPTWTTGNSGRILATIATFKASSGVTDVLMAQALL